MNLTDEQFREEYHPIVVPSHFDASDTEQNQLIFALAQLGEGSAAEVLAEFEKLLGSPVNKQQQAFIPALLQALFDKGLLGGREEEGIMRYNLHKITQANDGATNPDLLAPGLD